MIALPDQGMLITQDLVYHARAFVGEKAFDHGPVPLKHTGILVRQDSSRTRLTKWSGTLRRNASLPSVVRDEFSKAGNGEDLKRVSLLPFRVVETVLESTTRCVSCSRHRMLPQHCKRNTSMKAIKYRNLIIAASRIHGFAKPGQPLIEENAVISVGFVCSDRGLGAGQTGAARRAHQN